MTQMVDLDALTHTEFADQFIVAVLKNTNRQHQGFLDGFLHKGEYLHPKDALESVAIVEMTEYLIDYYGGNEGIFKDKEEKKSRSKNASSRKVRNKAVRRKRKA